MYYHNRETNANVDGKATTLLQTQEEQTILLREIYRLSQLKLEGSKDGADSDQPIWLVPIGRNPDFVGRESTIEDLKGRLDFASDSTRTVVLFGLGGVG